MKASAVSRNADHSIQDKWGAALANGFVVVPTLLLRRQHELGLESTELVVLLNLLAAWWDVSDLPFPRSSTIANRMGVSVRTVQRCLEQLERKNLILRVGPEQGKSGVVTRYDLAGTVHRLQELAFTPAPSSASDGSTGSAKTEAPAQTAGDRGYEDIF